MKYHKYIYILFSSVLFAQQLMKAKEWQEISCTGIEQLSCNNMWAFGTESNQYLINLDGPLFQFVANENNAKLSFYRKIYRDGKMYCAGESKFYFTNEFHKYCYYFDIVDDSWYTYYDHDNVLKLDSGQCFFMNNNHYFLDYNASKLYQLKLVEDNILQGHIEISNQWSLNYTPTEILSVVVLKDTLYYLSGISFYSLKISNNAPVYEPISSVTGIDEFSIFVTDYKNKIWILNSATGVIEYDSTTQTATKIAEFPGNTRSTDFSKACLYYNGYLYYIDSNAKVYALNVADTPTPPTPPTPPTDVPEQSGKSCGCLGLEFLLALAGLFIFRTIAMR